MAWECTWIITWEEMYSEGGGSVSDILILGAIAFDNQLASEEVISSFFLRVRDCTWLLESPREGFADGECVRPQEEDGRTGSSGGSCGSTLYQE
jgi:hypothetical protein